MASSGFLPDCTGNVNIDMVHQGYRLATLAALPDAVPGYRSRIAEAGFYYMGENGVLICFKCQCRIEPSQWRDGENALAIHSRVSPQCEHVQQMQRQITAGTVSGNDSQPSSRTQSGMGSNVSVPSGAAAVSTSAFSSITPVISGTENCPSVVRPETSGASRTFPRPILDLSLAVHPTFVSLDSRKLSFQRVTWSSFDVPPLDVILLSGFFYAGYMDCVRCFYCGLSLKNWSAADNVWDEHIRWRPSCGFLHAVKSEEFIRETQRRLGIEVPPNTAPGSGPMQSTTSAPQASTTASMSVSPSSHVSAGSATTPATTTARGSAGTPSVQSLEGNRSRQGQGSNPAGSVTNGGRAGLAVEPLADEEQRQTLASLQEENQRLHRLLQCSLCHENPVNTIFLPCGHLLACASCAQSANSCPRCRSLIMGTALVFMT